MKFLEKDHAVYAADLAEKRLAEEKRNEFIMNAVAQCVHYLETMNGPKY